MALSSLAASGKLACVALRGGAYGAVSTTALFAIARSRGDEAAPCGERDCAAQRAAAPRAACLARQRASAAVRTTPSASAAGEERRRSTFAAGTPGRQASAARRRVSPSRFSLLHHGHAFGQGQRCAPLRARAGPAPRRRCCAPLRGGGGSRAGRGRRFRGRQPHADGRRRRRGRCHAGCAPAAAAALRGACARLVCPSRSLRSAPAPQLPRGGQPGSLDGAAAAGIGPLGGRDRAHRGRRVCATR